MPGRAEEKREISTPSGALAALGAGSPDIGVLTVGEGLLFCDAGAGVLACGIAVYPEFVLLSELSFFSALVLVSELSFFSEAVYVAVVLVVLPGRDKVVDEELSSDPESITADVTRIS